MRVEFFNRVENIVTEGECACNLSSFSFCHKYFLKMLSAVEASESVYIREMIKSIKMFITCIVLYCAPDIILASIPKPVLMILTHMKSHFDASAAEGFEDVVANETLCNGKFDN